MRCILIVINNFNNSYCAGDMASACMFKRAAHLALGSVKRWQTPEGYLQIVKNHFNPSLRWGYEVYSYFSQYNLLPVSQMATAYEFATDDIDECTSFADAGGFAFQLPLMKKVIANAGGTYVEIETGADPHYDSTGLQRLHINNCGTQPGGECVAVHSMIGPTAGPPQENNGMTVGVFWKTDSDSASAPIHRLGNQTYATVAASTFTPGDGWCSENVIFTVEYLMVAQNVVVTETYSVYNNASVAVTASAQLLTQYGDPAARRRVLRPKGKSPGHPMFGANATRFTSFGVTFPVFLFDGATNTSLQLPSSPGAPKNSTTALLSAASGTEWGQQNFTLVGPPAGHTFTWYYDGTDEIVVRNGLASPLDVAVNPINTDSPSLSYILTGSGVATNN